jgi:hypothetical protein
MVAMSLYKPGILVFIFLLSAYSVYRFSADIGEPAIIIGKMKNSKVSEVGHLFEGVKDKQLTVV